MDYVVIGEEPDREKGLDLEATKKRVCELIKEKGLKDKTIADSCKKMGRFDRGIWQAE